MFIEVFQLKNTVHPDLIRWSFQQIKDEVGFTKINITGYFSHTNPNFSLIDSKKLQNYIDIFYKSQ